MSYRVASNERGKDLDLALFSVVDTENLGGKKLFSIVRDLPYVSHAPTKHGAIMGFGQSPAEVMRFG